MNAKMFSRDLPSPSSMFSSYASMMGYITMFKPMVNTIIPRPVQNFAVSYVKSFFRSRSSTLTLTINQYTPTNNIQNELFCLADTYLSTKNNPEAVKLNMARDPTEKYVKLSLSNGEVVYDVYKGIKLKWRFFIDNKKSTMVARTRTRKHLPGNFDREYFELSVDKKHRDLVLNSYIPYVESKAKVINSKRRILKMHSYYSASRKWQSVNFKHASTFKSMAMNNELKRSVMEDLDRFIKRKEFYKRVGKAWKRGYLLYGPPGTGKTSLVAAMANYLKFDIYDLQLASVQGDADLRRLLLGVKNSSILLIEDIDCSVDLPTRLKPTTEMSSKRSTPMTLSGLLNCVDGLWSSCGNERIIIFTTNNKDMLEPALLRPGRMDMHIYMGHCGFDGFKTLASNYLGLSEDTHDDPHRLYPEIKHLIDGKVLTPAQVAEELMKNEDVDMALEGLVNVLKRKRSEPENSDDEAKKKMKKLEEGESKISDLDETSERQGLSTAQEEDEEEVREDEQFLLRGGINMFRGRGLPGRMNMFRGRGLRGRINMFRGRGLRGRWG